MLTKRLFKTITEKACLIATLFILTNCRCTVVTNQKRIAEDYLSLISKCDTVTAWKNSSFFFQKKMDKSSFNDLAGKIYWNIRKINKPLLLYKSGSYKVSEGNTVNFYTFQNEKVLKTDTVLEIELTFVDLYPDKIHGLRATIRTPESGNSDGNTTN